MKVLFSVFFAVLFMAESVAQNVGIGTTSPVGSAQLDVTSATKGLLPPRMTTAQRDAILTPAAGLMVWCNNCGISGEMQVFNGTRWTNMLGGVSSAPEATICGQKWMVKNLDVTTYRNGDPIPKVTDNAVWSSLTTGAYCYYNNDSATYAATYGKLYNWFAAADPRGLAPLGWHIPSNTEWTTLETCLGGSSLCGGPMKEAGTSHWISPNAGATNSSGFTGLPGAGRELDGSFFFNIGENGLWWSATPANTVDAFNRRLGYGYGGIFIAQYNMRNGNSVRCLRD